MIISKAPQNWKRWIEKLSEQLHGRSNWRLAFVFYGIIFAQGRKTVSSWLRAAEIGKGFQEFYSFLESLGEKTTEVAEALWTIVLRHILSGVDDVTVAIDDTPERRYGKKIETCGYHHDSTSKPGDQTYYYGNVWVTLAIVVNHIRFGTIALPLLSKLYVRECDIAGLTAKYGWLFQTKLQLANALIDWFFDCCVRAGKKLWVVFDGAYVRRSFLRNLPLEACAIGRLRHDAALKSLPAPRRSGQRGRPRIYGKNRVNLAKRAGQRRAWNHAEVRGKDVKYKAFKATYRPAGGQILVIIREFDNGTWAAYCCSDPDADPIKVLERIIDRWSIEECFHDIKENLGAEQQQVRKLWSNVATWHLSLWTYSLVHLWAWFRSSDSLIDRSSKPWDNQERRPSFEDRLRSLRRYFIGSGIFDVLSLYPVHSIIRRSIETIYRLIC